MLNIVWFQFFWHWFWILNRTKHLRFGLIWFEIQTVWPLIIIFYIVETMVGSTMDITTMDDDREQSPHASTDK